MNTDIARYSVLFIIVMAVTYVTNTYKQISVKSEEDEEYELIRTYLLNESPLYGYNKPKLWIHTTYEVNSRQWKSFYSRNTTDLNQPYIHLTVKTMINHCGNDFNVCLIDDQSFSKLIPTWKIDVGSLPEPLRSKARALGMVQLLHLYGGMVVPNSFLCTKNLKELYAQGTKHGAFVIENVNRAVLHCPHTQKRFMFAPNIEFMGCKKGDPIMRDFSMFLKKYTTEYFVESESSFLGEISQWCLNAIDHKQMQLLGGELVGIKSKNRNVITLDDLMEDTYLELHPDCFGLWIPAAEILSRPKFQWFASLTSEEILHTNSVLTKYLKASIVDSNKGDQRLLQQPLDTTTSLSPRSKLPASVNL